MTSKIGPSSGHEEKRRPVKGPFVGSSDGAAGADLHDSRLGRSIGMGGTPGTAHPEPAVSLSDLVWLISPTNESRYYLNTGCLYNHERIMPTRQGTPLAMKVPLPLCRTQVVRLSSNCSGGSPAQRRTLPLDDRGGDGTLSRWLTVSCEQVACPCRPLTPSRKTR